VTMRPLILVPGNALVVIDASSQGLWPIGSYPETLVLYRTRPARLPNSSCHLLRGASDTAV
jgi:hypothetical protein